MHLDLDCSSLTSLWCKYILNGNLFNKYFPDIQKIIKEPSVFQHIVDIFLYTYKYTYRTYIFLGGVSQNFILSIGGQPKYWKHIQNKWNKLGQSCAKLISSWDRLAKIWLNSNVQNDYIWMSNMTKNVKIIISKYD